MNTLPAKWLRIPSIKSGDTAAQSLPKKLIIDVSSIAHLDAKTGIQRVVRNLYQQLLLAPPVGFQIVPVMATRRKFYQAVPVNFLQEPSPAVTDATPIQIHVGDIFLGLDLSAHIIPHHLPALCDWKKQGLRMTFVIYDLLPVLQPQWFNDRVSKNFKKWLNALAILADNTVAISRSVQSDFDVWMHDVCRLGETDLPCAAMQLGAELNTDDGTTTDALGFLPAKLASQKFILMVGTLEPRKGHADVIDAFETLWGKCEQIDLVIVGKQGWKVEQLIERLHSHSEAGKRLHWLNNANDDVLRSLYQGCKGVIVASKGEGFGLPLIEAAYFNKPVLARDIPVFREISGSNVSFFNGMESNDLVELLSGWLRNLDAESSAVNNTSWISWRESCWQLNQLLRQFYDYEKDPVDMVFDDNQTETALSKGQV
ncbi:glycosyltransferase family 1 protein [Undibacterium sp. GrIS 1.8]|uniref:glycosyltransferase family 4 protein n=1 Tax=Undibacterium sp. GrIS 1.8 TaxID=3143934 RepID=UPI00339935F7